MLAPVVLFVYNRPEHTKKTIEALSKNTLAKETVLYIFSDGKKEEDNSDNVEKTRAYIKSGKDLSVFKKVIISESQTNKGLAKSIIIGVTQVLNEYQKAIVMEDDLISHPKFLSFMNAALNEYERSDDIWSISGYTIPIKIPEDYQKDIFITPRGSSWGWGTWKNEWDLVDWQVKDYAEFKHDRAKRHKFNRGGRDLTYLLDDQMNGKVDSWAIRWYYAQFVHNKYTIYPVNSFIKNIGLDGTGTHSGKNRKYRVEFSESTEQFNDMKFNLEYPEFDEKILKRFRKYYLSYKGFIYRKIKHLIGNNN
ncbi:sugar transferase [Aerococcaceae bacterium DSM 111021]|nr:sugar transferase [Aerococcaceae bacterium DSM 111021]